MDVNCKSRVFWLIYKQVKNETCKLLVNLVFLWCVARLSQREKITG